MRQALGPPTDLRVTFAGDPRWQVKDLPYFSGQRSMPELGHSRKGLERSGGPHPSLHDQGIRPELFAQVKKRGLGFQPARIGPDFRHGLRYIIADQIGVFPDP